MSRSTLVLIVLGLVFSHSAAWAWGYIIGDMWASDRVNRQWIFGDEWQRFTASPWIGWMKHRKGRKCR